MEGSVGLGTGSGLAVCGRAGVVGGRCREHKWAWSRPGWRRAEDDECSDQAWFINLRLISINQCVCTREPQEGARSRLQLVIPHLDTQVKEKPQDVDVCGEKVLGVTSNCRG